MEVCFKGEDAHKELLSEGYCIEVGICSPHSKNGEVCTSWSKGITMEVRKPGYGVCVTYIKIFQNHLLCYGTLKQTNMSLYF